MHFKLQGGEHEAAGVLRELAAFLEELRASVGDASDLTIDITSMPLLVDASFLQQLAGMMHASLDSFSKVKSLQIVTAGGLQELIARGIVSLLPGVLAEVTTAQQSW